MRDVLQRLQDIKECIAVIEKYTSQGRKDLDESGPIQSHIIRQLEIIGESVRHLPQSFKSNYPFIPWKEISGMRDMLIHQYFFINKDVLWETIEQDMPELKLVIDRGIRELEGT